MVFGWLSIFTRMKEKRKFIIQLPEIIFWLPLGANNLLQKAIKNSPKLHTFTIQEDSFNDKDWSIISQGIIERKNGKDSPAKLKITFTKINKNNMPFISRLLRKAVISEIIFHDCAFDAAIIDDFCKAIAKSSSILREITFKNASKTIPDKIIQDISKAGKRVEVGTEICLIREENDITKIKNDARYVFDDMEELSLASLNIEDPRLCYAVRESPCLRRINISTTSMYYWQWMKRSIMENKSIQSISLNSDNNYVIYNETVMPMLMEILSQKGIPEFLILDRLAFNIRVWFEAADLIRKNQKLQHLSLDIFGNKKLSDTDYYQDIKKAIEEHPTLTKLTLKSVRITITEISDLLRINPRISSLTLNTRIYSDQSNTIDVRWASTLKELCFEQKHFGLGQDSVFTTGPKLPSLCQYVAPILRNNRHIQTIDIVTLDLPIAVTEDIFNELKDHPSLTSFSFFLLGDRFCEEFAELMRNNTKLKHIGLNVAAEWLQNETFLDLQSAIISNKTLRSLTIKTFECSPIYLQFIKGSKNITSFTYRPALPIDAKEKEQILSAIEETLEDNEVLTRLEVYCAEKKLALNQIAREKLKRNDERQRTVVNYILVFIGMVAARPQIYLSILPLELWSNIFKRISVPGVDVDFDLVLMKHFENT